jgi:hypothetical protein
MSRCLSMLIVGIAAAMAAGCGGGSPSSVPPQGTSVAVTFAGATMPQAVATQSGGGPFEAASLQGGNQLFLTLPIGTTKYGIAYVCATFNDEFVFEATTQDATALTLNCPSPSAPSALGAATGSVDASAIAGATNVSIRGNGGAASLAGVTEPFSVPMQDGVNDVAFIAMDSNSKAVGVKIARGQNIPGAVNGGSTVVFGAGDAITTQPVTINNVPAGFPVPNGVFAQYHTANGTAFPLLLVLGFNSPLPGTYPAVPAGATQSGDFYLYQSSTSNIPGANQQVGTTLTTTTGGGPLTMTYPALWSFAGPTPAKLPTFTFDYSGFSGQPAVSQQVLLTWPVGTSRNLLQVMATANFQNGANTLTIPDLTALAGFFPPAASGAQVGWIADIFGGTTQQFIFSVNPPANGSLSFVENRGSYLQP